MNFLLTSTFYKLKGYSLSVCNSLQLHYMKKWALIVEFLMYSLHKICENTGFHWPVSLHILCSDLFPQKWVIIKTEQNSKSWKTFIATFSKQNPLLRVSFIKRQTSCASSDNAWQQLTTSENEWQRMTKIDNSDNKW